MGYWLGVDLGTTFSAAAICRDGTTETVTLGNKAHSIPSVVYVRDDGEILVGEPALRRAIVDPTGIVREFKRRFGDHVPIVVRGTPYSAEFFAGRLLANLVSRTVELAGEPPLGVVLTHPANWGPFRQGVLREAAAIAELGDVELLSEAQAAGIHYAQQNRVDVGALIAVYDLGGGTFDAAVVRKTETGFELVGDAAGLDRLGGIDFDEAVFHHVRAALATELEAIDTDDPNVTPALAQLRADCVLAKEDLSVESASRIPVLLPGVATDVRMTRVELQNSIRPLINETIAALHRALAAAGVDPADLDCTLLVGGSSRIPLVSELVAGAIDGPIAVDAHPKYAVAMGAARHGWQQQGTIETAPVEPAPIDTAPVEPAPTEPVSIEPVPPAPTGATLPVPVETALATIDRPGDEATDTGTDPDAGSLLVTALLGIAALALIGVAVWFFLIREDGTSEEAGPEVASVTTSGAGQGTESTVDPADVDRPTTVAIVEQTPTGVNPWTPLHLDDELWVPIDGDGQLIIIDPADHSVIDTVDLEGVDNPACPPGQDERAAPETPLEAGGLVWVPDRLKDVVYRIDPATRSIDEVFCVGENPQQLAASDAAVWARGRDDATLTRIDLATLETTRFELGQPTGAGFEIAVAAQGREVWAVTANPPAIHRFDRNSQQFTEVATLVNPYDVTIAGGSVWAADRPGEGEDDLFYRRILETGEESTIPAGNTPFPPVEADGAMWFSSFTSGTVNRLDLTTSTLTHELPVDGSPLPPVADNAGNLWVVSRGESPALTRIDVAGVSVEDVLPLVGPRADVPVMIGDRIWIALAGSDAILEVYFGPDDEVPG